MKEKKSRKVTVEQLDRARDLIGEALDQLNKIQDTIKQAETNYLNLTHRASAATVKEHLLAEFKSR